MKRVGERGETGKKRESERVRYPVLERECGGEGD